MNDKDITIEGNDKEQVAIKEETPPEQPLVTKPDDKDAVAPKKEEKKELSPITVGYEVGVRKDGQFVFEIKGTQPGLVELLGIHKFAEKKIGLLYDRAQMEGHAAIAVQFQQVIQRINALAISLKEVLNTLVVSNASKKE